MVDFAKLETTEQVQSALATAIGVMSDEFFAYATDDDLKHYLNELWSRDPPTGWLAFAAMTGILVELNNRFMAKDEPWAAPWEGEK